MPLPSNSKNVYLGVMSGTSVDGLDIAAARFTDKIDTLKFSTCAYPYSLKEKLLRLSGDTSTAQLAEIDTELGKFIGTRLSNFLRDEPWKDDVAAIGSHGHTAFHLPQGEHTNSLQIGNPAWIAELTELPVVTDFRRNDMASGGQGAPLAPVFHQYLAGQHKQNVGFLNLGGIANLTVIENHEIIAGFDTGPANTLLDTWFQRHHHDGFDRDSDWASTGKIDQALLSVLLKDQYFAKPAPKSTGKEYFNFDWLEKKLPRQYLPADIQRTLLALTVNTSASACQQWLPNGTLYVCGGGANNQRLMEALAASLPDCRVDTTKALGIEADQLEAVAFAWLAKQRLEKIPLKTPAATGARQARLAGAIYRC